ncbi:sulfurtransferase TusA family protein [Devosia sp. XK-2]|uniref:sulfurtransferase TusA family protein n=1 Tax=Devosia sp. XK-2 TaxID=3126689 RepID=UPI0030D2E6FA
MAIDDDIIDARGLKCPLPVLKLEKRLAGTGPVRRVIVLATDPMAKIDIPLYCRQKGYACLEVNSDGHLKFVVTSPE